MFTIKRARSDYKLRSKSPINSKRTKSAPKVARIGFQRHIPTKSRTEKKRTKSEPKYNNEEPNIQRKVYSVPKDAKKSKKKGSDIYLDVQPKCSKNVWDKRDKCYLGPISYTCLKKNEKNKQPYTVVNPNKKPIGSGCYDRESICNWFLGAARNDRDPDTQKPFKDLDNWLDETCPLNIVSYIDTSIKSLLKRIDEHGILNANDLAIIVQFGRDLIFIREKFLTKTDKIPTYVQKEIKLKYKEYLDKYIVILKSLVQIKNANDLKRFFPYIPMVMSTQNLAVADTENLFEWLTILENNYDIFIKSQNRTKIPDDLWKLLIKLHFIFRIADYAVLSKAFDRDNDLPVPRDSRDPLFSSNELPLTNLDVGLDALRETDRKLVDKLRIYLRRTDIIITKRDNINYVLDFYVDGKPAKGIIDNLIHALKSQGALAFPNESEENRIWRNQNYLEKLERDIEYRQLYPDSSDYDDYPSEEEGPYVYHLPRNERSS